MSKQLITIFALLLPFSVGALDVNVMSLHNNSSVQWSISNELDHTLFSSQDFQEMDSCLFELEDDTKFYFNIIIDSVAAQDTNLYQLEINASPVMLIAADIGLGEFSYPFFTGTKEPHLKIIGGSDVSIEDFPWQVYFQADNYACGGTIISSQWILTAAHCTMDGNNRAIDAKDMVIVVATTDLSDISRNNIYDIKSYTIHEDYNTSNYQNDIAVLELEEAIDFTTAQAIELISSDDVDNGATYPGVMSDVTGWGLNNVRLGTFPDILQKAELPIVSNTTAYYVWGYQPPSMLMAGYIQGNMDACSGDSGGPLVVDVDGTDKIAGIVSWGSGDCDTYGGYTRVSSFLDWIAEQTGVEPRCCIDKPLGDCDICYGEVSTTYSELMAGVSDYEWEFSPAEAGSFSSNEGVATVVWNPDYVGAAELRVRGVLDGELSSWSVCDLEVMLNTLILSEAGDSVICEGAYAELELVAEGHDLLYEWYKDDVLYWRDSTGLLTFFDAEPVSSGVYYCMVSGSCGVEQSRDFSLTVLPRTQVQSISEDQAVVQEEDVHFYVEVVGDELYYQWYKDEEMIAGANDSTLDLQAVNAVDLALYSIVVEGTCENDTSDFTYLYVDINTQEALNARVWPSVMDDAVNTAISTENMYSIAVYNTNSVLVYSNKSAQHQAKVDVSSWGAGMYIVKITRGSYIETFRVVKK